MARPVNLPAPSWASVPSKFTREEAKTWRDWNENDKGADPNYGRFTCSGPTSWGGRVDDVDEMYERMVKRGIVAEVEPRPVEVVSKAELKRRYPPVSKKRKVPRVVVQPLKGSRKG